MQSQELFHMTVFLIINPLSNDKENNDVEFFNTSTRGRLTMIICSIRKQFFNPFNAKVPLSLPSKIIRKPEVFFREYKGKH